MLAGNVENARGWVRYVLRTTGGSEPGRVRVVRASGVTVLGHVMYVGVLIDWE